MTVIKIFPFPVLIQKECPVHRIPLSSSKWRMKKPKLSNPSVKGVLQLIVFAVDKSIEKNGEAMYHRIGWKRRLLPPDCDYSKTLECFPARLARTPLRRP